MFSQKLLLFRGDRDVSNKQANKARVFLIFLLLLIMSFSGNLLAQCTLSDYDCSADNAELKPYGTDEQVEAFEDDPKDILFEEFMGINLRRSDPIEAAKCVGIVREYHNWEIDETFGPIYPDNRYEFRPADEGASLINSFDLFYEKINQQVGPVCATLVGASSSVSDETPNADETWITPPAYLDTDGNYCGGSGAIDYTNTTNPLSYEWRGDYVTQFVNRYGGTNDATQLLAADNDKNDGPAATIQSAGLVQYIENWNEQDDWFSISENNGQGQDGCFTPDVYGTMSIVDFNGNNGTMMAENQCLLPNNQYPIGIESLNRDIQFVMGGLSELDECFLMLLDEWFTDNGHDFPFHVLNFHHYSDGDLSSLQLGISPEEDFLYDKLKRLDLIRDEFFEDRELWLSEFGYNTLPDPETGPFNDMSGISPANAHVPKLSSISDDNLEEIFNTDLEEIQGQWIVRSYLAIAAADFDKAFVYEIRDATSNPIGRWDSKCGLLKSIDLGYERKKSWFYTYSLKNILTGMDFNQIIQDGSLVCDAAQPRIYQFSGGDKDVYAIWSPTSCEATEYDFNLLDISAFAGMTEADYYRLEVPSTAGILEQSTTNALGELNLPVSERPIFLIVGGDPIEEVACVDLDPMPETTCTSVKLSWDIPQGQVYDHYQIWYAPTMVNNLPNPQILLNPNILSDEITLLETEVPGYFNQALVTGLTTGETYHIYVVPHTANGSSGWCMPITVGPLMGGDCNITLSDPTVATVTVIQPDNSVTVAGSNEEHLYDGILSSSATPPDITTGIHCCNLPNGWMDDGNNTWFHNEGTITEIELDQPYDIDVIYLHDGNGIGAFTIQYQDGNEWLPYVDQYISSLGGGEAPFNGGTWVPFANDINPCQPIQRLRIFGEQQGDAIGELVICGKPFADYQATDAIFTTIDDGCGTVTFVPNNEDAGVEYHWDFGDGNYSMDMNPTHFYELEDLGVAETFTVSLMVVAPDNLCGTATNQDIEVMNCAPEGCDCPDDALVIGTPNTSTNISTLFNGPNPPLSYDAFVTSTNVELIIQGTLVMDVNNVNSNTSSMPTIWFIDGGNICMTPGANIVIPDDNLIFLGTGVHLRGCNARWESIVVESGGELLLSSVRIEDGQRAVKIEDGGEISGIGENSVVRFNRNYIGLSFENPTVGSLTNTNGVNFTCMGNLLPHYDENDPEEGDRSYAGIEIKGQGILNVGNEDDNFIFNNLRNGIVSENCELTVRNCHFNNILRGEYPISGNGIFATGEGQILNISEEEPVSTFNTCFTGIRTQGMSTNIQYVEMNEIRLAGIFIEDAAATLQQVEFNNIHSYTTGIWLNNTDGAAGILLNANFLEIENTPTPQFPTGMGHAIRVTENGVPHQSALLKYNTCHINDAFAGIHLEASNGILVDCNTIHAQKEEDNYSAIRLDNSTPLMLRNNYILGDYNNLPQTSVTPISSTGIRSIASPNVIYSCNGMINIEIGVQFGVMCLGTQFQTTHLENHRWGLHYTELGSTGPQPVSDLPAHANRWEGNWFGAVGARHENNDLNVISQSIYTIPENINPIGPGTIQPTSAASTWFEIVSGKEEIPFCPIEDNPCIIISEDLDVTVEIPGLSDGTEIPVLGELERKIARGEYIPGGYDISLTWMAERYLYEKLRKNPLSMASDADYELFYTSKNNSSIAQFTNIFQAIEQMYEIDEATLQNLRNLYTQRLAKIEAIRLVDSTLFFAEGLDSLQLLNERQVHLNQLVNYSQSNQSIHQTLQTNRSSQADILLAQNDNISVNHIFEQNEKTVNHIFLSTLAKGITELDDAQINNLIAIADQCPHTGGTSVFKARSILASRTDILFDNECQTNSQQSLSQANTDNDFVETTSFSIFPNPTKNQVTVKFDEGSLVIPKHLIIFNVHGKRVMDIDVPEYAPSYTMQVEQLPQGIYYLTYTTDKGTPPPVKKLVILH